MEAKDIKDTAPVEGLLLPDRTLDLDIEVAHDTLAFLRDDNVPTNPVDWSYIHHLFSPPYLPSIDCAELCQHEIGEKAREYADKTGRSKGWCCNHGDDEDAPVPYYIQLMGEGEADYLFPHLGDNVIRSYEDEEEFQYVCGGGKTSCCPRQWRPFWCRAFPFLPLTDRNGNISGVYNAFQVSTQPASSEGKCYLRWDEVREIVPVAGEPSWNDRFLLGWGHAMEYHVVREFVADLILEPIQEQVYKLDLSEE